jgi:hypothetical protein
MGAAEGGRKVTERPHMLSLVLYQLPGNQPPKPKLKVLLEVF